LSRRNSRSYVWQGVDFGALAPKPGAQFMGLFEPSHMQFDADRGKDPGKEPSLAEMTGFAIKQLQTHDKGYFLLVEGGRIDHAHHFGNAYRALVDTVALSDAVSVAVQNVDLSETLIVVTADHSHTLTISGYPPRGNPILGKVMPIQNMVFPDSTILPYTTLSYANGTGYRADPPDLTDVDTTAPNYQQLAAVKLPMETHAGEDVAAFATGINAAQVRGVMEQNKLYDVMRDALFGH
jgi:alkaline phosphatase